MNIFKSVVPLCALFLSLPAFAQVAVYGTKLPNVRAGSVKFRCISPCTSGQTDDDAQGNALWAFGDSLGSASANWQLPVGVGTGTPNVVMATNPNESTSTPAAVRALVGADLPLSTSSAPEAVPAASNTSSVTAPPVEISAKEYGAVCNGINNDTPAIQNALDAAYAYTSYVPGKANVAVDLPQGTCVTQAPLSMSPYTSLVGQGGRTILQANYGSWSGATNDVIDVTITGSITGERYAEGGIREMTIKGTSNSGISNSTAINIYNTVANYSPSYQIPYFDLKNLMITQFDTGIEGQDWVSSAIDNVHTSLTRRGVWINGHVVNLEIGGGSSFSYSSEEYTSTTGATVGLSITANGKYCTSPCSNYPQGVTIHDSSLVAWDTNIQVSQGIAVNIHDNILDYAADGVTHAGSGVELDLVGGGTHVYHNYIAVNRLKGGYGVSILQPQSSGDGLWIENNQITTYAGTTAGNTDAGVYLAPSALFYGLNINGNTCSYVQDCIQVNSDFGYSTIRGNLGHSIGRYLINLSGVASLSHTALTVSENKEMDSGIPAVYSGTSSGATVGVNYGNGANPTPFNSPGGFSVGSATGFSGTRVVGSCTLTITSGIITSVSGC